MRPNAKYDNLILKYTTSQNILLILGQLRLIEIIKKKMKYLIYLKI